MSDKNSPLDVAVEAVVERSYGAGWSAGYETQLRELTAEKDELLFAEKNLLHRLENAVAAQDKAEAERDALTARVGRLREELKTIGETEHRSWKHGLNTYHDFALWAQNRARAVLKEDKDGTEKD